MSLQRRDKVGVWRWTFLLLGIRGKGTRPEAILNSTLTLVLLNEHRSRRSGAASSHVQNTGVLSACKRTMHAAKIFLSLSPRNLLSTFTRANRLPAGAACQTAP